MDLIAKYGPGAKLMLKMGYVPGTGLGKGGTGIVEPIIPELRKKGEGIGMMRVIQEDDGYSDNEDEDEEEEGDKIGKFKVNDKPLGFERKGEYVSDYVVEMELYDIIRGLQEVVDLDGELLKILEKSTGVEIKMKLYGILKELRLDASKEKYLLFEIERLNQLIEIEEKDKSSIQRMIDAVSNDEEWEELLEVINSSSSRVNKDLILLAGKYIEPIWSERVNDCDFDDIAELGKILDAASEYLKVNIIVPEYKSIILEPIWNKLKTFYEEWEPYYEHAGLGVLEEIDEAHLFKKDDILRDIIVPKFLNEIKTGYGDELHWLDSWLWDVSDYKEVIRDAVGEKILEMIFEKNYLNVDYFIETYSDMKTWTNGGLDLEPYVIKYCKMVSDIGEDDILSNEGIEQYKVFVETLEQFDVEGDVFYDEVFSKYLNEYEQFNLELYGLTEIISFLGLMEEEYVKIITKVRELWENDGKTFSKGSKPNNIGTIKDIVFQWCEEQGKSIIPYGTLNGKDIYSIEGIQVYFEGKVMFKRNGDPIGLSELSI